MRHLARYGLEVTVTIEAEDLIIAIPEIMLPGNFLYELFDWSLCNFRL